MQFVVEDWGEEGQGEGAEGRAQEAGGQKPRPEEDS